MIPLNSLSHLNPNKPLKILALGSHCDDIEIGCGATLLRLIEEYDVQEVDWVVFSSNKTRLLEAHASAESYLSTVNKKSIQIKNFRNGYFPFVGCDIKDYFEELKESVCPDIIFTHYLNDAHQDHKTISQLTWNTFRNHLIFEYEIPKYDGDIGNPNVFIPVSHAQKNSKVMNILNYFSSQNDRQWFTKDTFEGMMRLRGIESNAPDGYAEAFHVRKLVL